MSIFKEALESYKIHSTNNGIPTSHRINQLTQVTNILETYLDQMFYFIENIRSNNQPMNSFNYAVKILKRKKYL